MFNRIAERAAVGKSRALFKFKFDRLHSSPPLSQELLCDSSPAHLTMLTVLPRVGRHHVDKSNNRTNIQQCIYPEVYDIRK